MKYNKVHIDLDERSYDVIIEKGSISKISNYLKKIKTLPNRGIMITQKKVFNLYGEQVLNDLKQNGYHVDKIFIPDGESAKSLQIAEKIYNKMIQLKLNRSSFVIALGGGVVGDLAGFVSSTYLRGVHFIQIPTTLLSQVDSSVGGKVAVNLPHGKNLVGSFYQPRIVVIDPETLNSLHKKEWTNGLAEVIKYGLIIDRPFFDFLYKNSDKIMSFDAKSVQKMIWHSVKNKAYVVSQDEKEKGLRAILNFGHTFGHSIEKTWNYKTYTHGHAVAIGMNMASEFSLNAGLLSKEDYGLIYEIFNLYDLNVKLKDNRGIEIYKNLFYDKKMTNKGLNFIFIKKIGEVFVTNPYDQKKLKKYIMEYSNEK